MSEIFQTSVIATGGRGGAVYSTDGELVFDLAIPKEMGGSGGSGTNPEELFAAGYAACFLGSVELAARRKKVLLPKDVTVSTTVHLGKEDVGFGISVEIVVNAAGMETEIAERLVDAAHSICPYSRAMQHGANVTISLSLDA